MQHLAWVCTWTRGAPRHITKGNISPLAPVDTWTWGAPRYITKGNTSPQCAREHGAHLYTSQKATPRPSGHVDMGRILTHHKRQHLAPRPSPQWTREHGAHLDTSQKATPRPSPQWTREHRAHIDTSQKAIPRPTPQYMDTWTRRAHRYIETKLTLSG